LVAERTALINPSRAILLERGIVVPQGKRKLEHYLVILMGEDGRTRRRRLDRADADAGRRYAHQIARGHKFLYLLNERYQFATVHRFASFA
jgi:hypothetical protein